MQAVYRFFSVNLKDWLHHIEDQEKNSFEGIMYEESLSDEDEGT